MEAFLPDRETAIQCYFKDLKSRLNGAEFLVYGHSMGASLGLEVVSRLEKKGIFPQCFVASGNAGPGVRENKQRHLLPKAAFLKELKDMGGMPEDFFKHEELIDFCLPILKADFKIIDGEPDNIIAPIKTPITALMGKRENFSAEIENWRKFTQGECQCKVLEGDHFFIYDQVKVLVENVRR